jgi:predicted Zn finger-like uncharacterized protein
MIVTCPGCSSKYRVRNEAVPADGARMKCPKCETLFLAKPPAGGDPSSNMADDPSSMYQQLNPTTSTGPHALRNLQQQAQPAPAPFSPPQQQAQGFVPPQQKAAGPITSLFQAVDPSMLPAEAQRPPPPPQPAAPLTPSGLETDNAPRVRVAAPPPQPQQRSPEAARPPAPPSIGAVVGSWVAVGAGAVLASMSLVFFLWSSERANLDASLMPRMERSFGVDPPRSFIGKGEPDVADLRREAAEREARGDLAGAVVLWQRVKVRDPSDKPAAVAIAKLRADLGDQAEDTSP